MSNQLLKKSIKGYENIFPKTYLDAIKDRTTGVSLLDIINNFNMLFLSYTGDAQTTRLSIIPSLRKEGLWITYVDYDSNVVTEWYNGKSITDEEWQKASNWRKGSNSLVGDISITSDGYWVINGLVTEAKAQGEQGITPLLRFSEDYKLEVSYNEGKTYSTLGNITNYLRILRYIGPNESLPTSGIAEGTIYMKGPVYDETDTLNEYPIYRMWVYAWKDNTLAWQDNGEFLSIHAGIVQEIGDNENVVMSQKAVTDAIDAEAKRANNAEKNIASMVQQNAGDINILKNTSATKVELNAEVERAEAKEQELSSDLTTETERAQRAEKSNADAIAAEVERAGAKDAEIEGKVTELSLKMVNKVLFTESTKKGESFKVKKGDTLFAIVRNVSYTGISNVNLNLMIVNKSSIITHINNINVDAIISYTFTSDYEDINLALNIPSQITSCNVEVEYGIGVYSLPIINELHLNNIHSVYVEKTLGETNRVEHIFGNFKAGDICNIYVEQFDYKEGENRVVAVYDAEDVLLCSIYSNDVSEFRIKKDTKYISIRLYVESGNYTDVYPHFKLYSGTALDVKRTGLNYNGLFSSTIFPFLKTFNLWTSHKYNTLVLGSVAELSANIISFSFIEWDGEISKEHRCDVPIAVKEGLKQYKYNDGNIAFVATINWDEYIYIWRGYVKTPVIDNYGTIGDDSYVIGYNLFNTIERIENNASAVGTLSVKRKLTFSDSVHYYYKKFKKGETIRLVVEDYTTVGSGDSNIHIEDDKARIVAVGYTNGVIDAQIPEDTEYIKVLLGYISTITDMSCSYSLHSGTAYKVERLEEEVYKGINDIKEELDVKDSFYYSTTLSLNNKYTKLGVRLKKGKSLLLSVKNLIAEGTNVDKNVNVEAVYSDGTRGYIAVAYHDGTVKKIIQKDCEYIIIGIGLSGEVNNASADVTVTYSILAEVVKEEEFESYKSSISDEIDAVGRLSQIIDSESKTIYETSGQVTNFIYSADTYVGYNKPMRNGCILTQMEFSVFSPNAALGKNVDVVIGTIDQRGWLLPRKIYSIPVSKVNGSVITLDARGMDVIVNKNEVVFVKGTNFSSSQPNVTFGLSKNNYDDNNMLASTNNLNNAVTYNSIENLEHYKLDVIEFDTILVTKSEVESINSALEATEQKVSKVNKYTDVITGDSYEIKIVNGQIILQTLEFKKILVIGHSFVTYNNSPSADWYLDDGEIRAMAPSVNAHQWTKFLKDVYDAEVTIKGGVDFERSYSVDFDFASKWNIANDYDAICVYLNENAIYNDTMQASWEAMLRYLISAAPSAKIYCTGSWQSSNKEKAIRNACNSVHGIEYVDCVGLYYDGNIWRKGDYYLGRGGEYYPMGAPYTHPNDMGHLQIANRFLATMGKKGLGGTYNIELKQANGGIISTPNTTWLYNGIVTIRVEPSEGYTIESVMVSDVDGNTIEVTRRTNTMYDGTERVYYTFTMPNSDVIVTPTWRLLLVAT